MSPEQAIRNAARISEFIKDDAIQEALGRMERRCYEEFLASTSSEERVRSWAKATVLREFSGELHVVMDAGEIEVIKAAKAHASRHPKE